MYSQQYMVFQSVHRIAPSRPDYNPTIFDQCSNMNTKSLFHGDSCAFVEQQFIRGQRVWKHKSFQQASVKSQNITGESYARNHGAKKYSKGAYRKWFQSKVHSPEAYPDKFILLSYNILGDDNALFHSDLYCDIPPQLLDWSSRKRLICQELDTWKPDIMCFQEVDHFDELIEDFGEKGYSGIFKGRTGDAKDGCAIFWKKDRFSILQEESIEFNKYNLRDNVAQLCVFELKNNLMADHADKRSRQVEANSLQVHNHWKRKRIVIGNIHVLYNPKRGDIKLGQVRLLLQEAFALSQKWEKAPVVIAGDFNSTPQSALYQFLASSKLDLQAHDRKQVSGQVENVPGSDFRRLATSKQNRYKWDGDELKTATGRSNCTRLQHPLKLFSAYASVRGSSRIRDDSGEPLATSYHSKFLGTVDYIWHSKGLIPLSVLDTLPLDILQQTPGLPTDKWGSDHLALACEFALAKDEPVDNSNRGLQLENRFVKSR
uniref:Endonuclease/exonuclease/phosphatase domain-containing protein n=1 Tax=Araucaria cunninghamii TaxID=56994 RepID=A0A0D6R361_ARACU